VNDVIDTIVSRYINIHLAQKKAAKNTDLAIELRYGETRKSPVESFSKALSHIDKTFYQESLTAASHENLNRFEKQQGYAAVAPKGTHSKPQFVRSGKVGEARDFLKIHQIDKIAKMCSIIGVNVDGRVGFLSFQTLVTYSFLRGA